VLLDSKHSGTEPRLHALGKTMDGRRLHITFTLRDAEQFIRVISARDMHRKEDSCERSRCSVSISDQGLAAGKTAGFLSYWKTLARVLELRGARCHLPA